MNDSTPGYAVPIDDALHSELHEEARCELENLGRSDNPDDLFRSGLLCQKLGQHARALDYLERAAAHPLVRAHARARQATILRQLCRPKESFPMALQAINADMSVAEGWECAGALLIGNKKWPEASKLLALGVNALPESAILHAYYALALAKDGKPVLAYQHVQIAMHLEPELSVALLARIEAYCEAGYYDLALKDTVLLQDKDMPEAARFSFGSLAFMTGDYTRGMSAMIGIINSGWRGGEVQEWKGENLRERRVIIYGGQGYGDMLQFARYIQPFCDRAPHVVLHVPRNLTRLLADSFPGISLSIHEDDASQGSVPMPSGTSVGITQDVDFRCSFPGLIAYREGGFDVMADKVPYLSVRSELSQAWRDRLANIPRPWIGIVWAPGTWFNSNPSRTISYETLRPLIDLAGPHLISLQLGTEAEKTAKDGLFNASPYISDFADSAALINELDLLITFDSAPAHLAGALGKSVWTMLHFNADWRWLVEREDSIWYPTMRLYRQKQPQDWNAVVERMVDDLKRFLAGEKDALRSKAWVGPSPIRNPHALPLTINNC